MVLLIVPSVSTQTPCPCCPRRDASTVHERRLLFERRLANRNAAPRAFTSAVWFSFPQFPAALALRASLSPVPLLPEHLRVMNVFIKAGAPDGVFARVQIDRRGIHT